MLARLAATLDRVMGFRERADAAAALLVRNGLELVRIHLLDEEGKLELVASAGVRRADARMRRLDQLARQVAETGDTELVRGEPEGSFSTGRGAVAALHVRGRLLGTLTLRLPESSDLGMTAAFADEVASRLSHSLDNALRYEREREVSHALQAGLLGAAPAEVEGVEIATVYRPGSETLEVGGDWYDVFRLGDTTLALVVGDVVGHGLDAAVAMGQLRGAVRALAPTGSPSHVLDALDLFVEQVPQGAMATLAYAELDLEDGRLTYACAGHPPPLLLGSGGGRLLWEGRSLPLGASFEGHERTQATDRLAAGESILLYTDGLVEDRVRGISSGLDLLLEVAVQMGADAPSALVDVVVGRLVAEIDNEDDVCVLAVRRALSPTRFVHEFPASPGEVRKMRKALSGWLEGAGLDDEQDARRGARRLRGGGELGGARLPLRRRRQRAPRGVGERRQRVRRSPRRGRMARAARAPRARPRPCDHGGAHARRRLRDGKRGDGRAHAPADSRPGCPVTSGETQITRRSVGDVEVIELQGDVDFAIADDVREALCATDANVVIADLGSIDFIDSAGLRALDRANRELRVAGRTLALVAPPASRAAFTFRVAGFSRDGVHDSVDTVLQRMARS